MGIPHDSSLRLRLRLLLLLLLLLHLRTKCLNLRAMQVAMQLAG